MNRRSTDERSVAKVLHMQDSHDDIEHAKRNLLLAAIEFDALEDRDPDADWRRGFAHLRKVAEMLGIEDLFDHAGIE